MTQDEKIEALAELFDIDEAEVKAEVALDTLQWDSMAMLSLIALVKARCNRKLPGDEVRSLKTIGDVFKVME